ncbi:MAG: response regulator transcription factor [Acidimicrobiaceae bacterium]|nr:response regulator transcription factor [Acidimicrobiaceae bacterium]MBO0747299.1 response regulator transcription factor [Acidimicrobiaceae bacterium]
MKVLLVEDQAELAETVAAGLRGQGMTVEVAFDGEDALYRSSFTPYDVVLLDRNIPGVHGDEVCRKLIGAATGPRILMLTAASTIEDRVEGLGLGADDYLPKPFAFAELVARIRALGRRSGPATPPIFVHGDIQLDPARRVATRGGALLVLNPKEFAVLEQLLEAQGAVVSAEELLDSIWDQAVDPFTNTVKMTISRLRAKLGDPPIIETVSRSGYRI